MTVPVEGRDPVSRVATRAGTVLTRAEEPEGHAAIADVNRGCESDVIRRGLGFCRYSPRAEALFAVVEPLR